MKKLLELWTSLSNKLSQYSIPETVFFLFSIRLVINGASLGEALAVISLAGVYGFHKYLNFKDRKIEEAVDKQITDLQNAIMSLKMDKSFIRKTTANETQEKRYF